MGVEGEKQIVSLNLEFDAISNEVDVESRAVD
jgi:hypothetical protein